MLLGIVESFILIWALLASDQLLSQANKIDDADLARHRQTVSPLWRRILLGDIWLSNEYCNDIRPNKVNDDNQVMSYMLGRVDKRTNRYVLDTRNYLFDNNNSQQPHDHMKDTNFLNVKSIFTTAASCAAQTWGYQSSDELAQSSQADTNGADCYDELKKLTNELNLNETTIIGQTFGHVPDGFLDGNIFWLGSYESCTGYEQVLDKLDEPTYPMKYCLGALMDPNWPEESLRSNYFIRLGMCLPRSCSNSMLMSPRNRARPLIEELAKSNLLEPFKSRYILTDVYCLPDEESPLRQLDIGSKALIVVAFLWLSAILYFTCCDCLAGATDTSLVATDQHQETKTANDGDRYFDWRDNFSLVRNYKRFIKPASYHTKVNNNENQKEPPLIAFYVLDAIKVMMGIWLVISHGTIYYWSAIDNYRYHAHIGDNFVTHAIKYGVNVVAVFFIVAGFLMAHRELASNKLTSPWKFIMKRYLRLMPLYFIIYIFIKKFGHLTGSGPLWDYGIGLNSERRQCMKESWLVPTLLLGNFMVPFSHCIITGWHLACDFQCTLTMPLLIRLIKRTNLWGIAITFTVVLASASAYALELYYNDQVEFKHWWINGNILSTRTFMDRTGPSYVNPFYRVGCFYLGVIVAYFVVEYIKESNTSKVEHSNSGPDQGQEISLKNGADGSSNINDKTKYHQKQLKDKQQQLTSVNHLANDDASKAYSWKFILAALAVFGNINSESIPYNQKVFAYTITGESFSKSIGYPIVRFASDLGWSVLLYSLLIKDGPGWLHSLLKWPGWSYLVKLNFSLLLVHNELNRWLITSRTKMGHFNWSNLSQHLLAFVISAYIVTFFVHMVVEMPLNNLINHYITSRITNKRPSAPTGTSNSRK